METKSIATELLKVLNTYKNAVSGYSDQDFTFKQAHDIWSIGQMYEHLAISAQFFFMKNVQYCLEKRNGQEGGEMNEKGKYVYHHNAFPPIKVKVPAGASVAEPVANEQTYYADVFEKICQHIETQLLSIEADNGIYKTSHVVFGPLSAREWLQSFEMHHRHHLRQKEELEGFLADVK
jgi:hypothetical protein